METVAQHPAELNLLTNWSDADSGSRTRKAGILSVLLHAAAIFGLILVPADYLKPPEQPIAVRRVTPLVEPLTELTQKTPNTGKLSKEFNAAEAQPRPRIQIPAGAPSTTRPRAPRAAVMPSMPAPKQQPAPLPDAPNVQAAATPKSDMPQLPVTAQPQIQAVERRPVFENPSAPATVAPGKGTVPIPNTSVSDAIRQTVRGGSGGGVTVGDSDAGGPGGIGSGVNLPPSPGAQASNMQLLSDPMGVDFRPYLTQILAIVRRNWFAVMPESAKLGLRGRVGVLFAIAKNGGVTKANYATQSGAKALDQAAIAAISMSNPFPPLPAEFKGDRIVLQFNFAYNIPK